MSDMDLRIPMRVLADRGALSIPQAVAVYLVEDCELTHAEAQVMMGLRQRSEVGMLLRRARETLGRA